MAKGRKVLEKNAEYLRQVGAGKSRPPSWEGLGSEAAEEKERLKRLQISMVGGIPRLLLHELGVQQLTHQGVLTAVKHSSESNTRFLVGLSGCGKTRTIMERLAEEIGIFFTMGREKNFATGDFEYMVEQLRRAIQKARKKQAEKEGKQHLTKHEDLSEEGREELLRENRAKARKYMRALLLSRLIVLVKVLEYATDDFRPLDWLFAQLNWRLAETDMFTDLFVILSEGRRRDVAQELKNLEDKIFTELEKRGQTGRAFCFLNELQEVFKTEGKFQSTRDRKKGTHLLSVLLTEEDDEIGDSGVEKGQAARSRTTRWQKIASGSGLRMTQLVKKGDSLSAKPDVRRRASLDRLHTVTDFRLFDSLDVFKEYVAPLLGKRLGEDDLEDAFSWIQGRPRLTSDFVTQVLLNDGSPISEVLRDYVDWHKGKQQDIERSGTSLYKVLQAFFVDGNKRPGVVVDVDIRRLLERVVKQWLKCGENVKLGDEKELALLDAGLAGVEKEGGRYLPVKIVEPLAIAAAIKLLSNGGGQDQLLTRFAQEDMELALTRPSLLGFLWEDCAYKLVKEWAEGPLSNHKFLGGKELPGYLATKGELVAFRIENGKIVKQEQKGPIARFGSGSLRLALFLMDMQGAHFFHPENSAGPHLVCLLRFRVGNKSFYALVWIQMKLRETVT
jgi:hypothetical protein